MKPGVFCGALFAALLTTVASLADDDVVRADKLFQEARQLIDRGDFASACPKLAESQRLDPGVGTALYLGGCYEHINKIGSAWTSFRDAMTRAKPGDKRGEIAKAEVQRLDGEASHLVLRPPHQVPDGLRVMLNREPMDASALGQSVAIDGGRYSIVVTARDYESWRTEVSVPERRGYIELQLDIGAPEVHPQQAQTVVAAPRPGFGAPRAVALIAAGAGVSALVVGSVLAISAKTIFDASNDTGGCNATSNVCSDQAGVGMRSDALLQADIATVLFIAGGVLLTGGVTLFLLAPKKAASLSPALGPRSASLVLTLSTP